MGITKTEKQVRINLKLDTDEKYTDNIDDPHR